MGARSFFKKRKQSKSTHARRARAPVRKKRAPPRRRVLRAEQVMEKVCLGRDAIHRAIKAEGFPKPFRLTRRTLGWFEDEIDRYLAARARERALLQLGARTREFVPFDINHRVRVKLTPYGRRYHRLKFLRLYGARELERYVAPSEDHEGWSEWPLWELLQEFGGVAAVDGPSAFEAELLIEKIPSHTISRRARSHANEPAHWKQALCAALETSADAGGLPVEVAVSSTREACAYLKRFFGADRYKEHANGQVEVRASLDGRAHPFCVLLARARPGASAGEIVGEPPPTAHQKSTPCVIGEANADISG